MAELNFITTYVPSYAELNPADVADTRDRLELFIRAGFPEMDINPNTVVGDLIVTPTAYTITALEAGMDRFMSDLNLANVADDVIYNCDFVEKYLQNFNVSPAESLQPSGVVRLVFSENKEVYMDRSTRFSFNGSVFSIYFSTTSSSYLIAPVGQSVAPGTDGTVLKDSGSGAYFADVPVVGVSGTANVPAGTSGLINTIAYQTLGAITALVDFDPGAVTRTLPQMAADTRRTAYAASLNTRNGAIRYVETTCPFAEGVYAIVTGDKEMLRSYDASAGYASSGCLDLYLRSKSYAFEEQQTIRLTRNMAAGVYEGAFDYVGQPYFIESVTAGESGDPVPYTLITEAAAGAPADMPVASYTQFEKLTLRVLIADAEKLTVKAAEDGSTYVDVLVTYKTDPMLHSVANTVTNSDNAPVNMSVMARGFIPVIIKQFEVKYVKKPGVQVLLDEARSRITEYLTHLGVPDVYTDGQINRIMDEAGVKYVKGINVKGQVQWSVATKMRIGGVEEDVQQGPYINSSGDLRISYRSPEVPSRYACSIRNVRYYLLENAITFSEVKEV